MRTTSTSPAVPGPATFLWQMSGTLHADFKGLMKSSIRDDNTVLFFLDVALLHTPGEVPDGDHVVLLGEAAIRRPGTDVTLVSYSKTVHNCLASVRKTGRLVVVHEASRTCGVGAEIAATVAEKAFASLRAPILRLAGPDAPAASSRVLEQAFVPRADTIARAGLFLCGISRRGLTRADESRRF